MKIALGSDHAGFELKEDLRTYLSEMGYDVKDFGSYSIESVDYPDIGLVVARAVAGGEFERGILVCGTGIGMSMVANKVPGVRAALCHDLFSARASREHNDANVLTLGARVIPWGLAREIVNLWLTTDFLGGRHGRRVSKIMELDKPRLPSENGGGGGEEGSAGRKETGDAAGRVDRR